MSPTAPQVTHDTQRHVFVLQEDGEEVLLRYRHPDAGSIDFYSTFTPPTLRGRGLARLVVDAGLDYARDHQLSVVPSCSYVAKIVEQTSARNSAQNDR